MDTRMLVCPECTKTGNYHALRIYHVLTVGVELEWLNGKAVMRLPGGDCLPLSDEIEGQEPDRNTTDGDFAECQWCDYSVSLDDVLYDDALYEGGGYRDEPDA